MSGSDVKIGIGTAKDIDVVHAPNLGRIELSSNRERKDSLSTTPCSRARGTIRLAEKLARHERALSLPKGESNGGGGGNRAPVGKPPSQSYRVIRSANPVVISPLS